MALLATLQDMGVILMPAAALYGWARSWAGTPASQRSIGSTFVRGSAIGLQRGVIPLVWLCWYEAGMTLCEGALGLTPEEFADRPVSAYVVSRSGAAAGVGGVSGALTAFLVHRPSAFPASVTRSQLGRVLAIGGMAAGFATNALGLDSAAVAAAGRRWEQGHEVSWLLRVLYGQMVGREMSFANWQRTSAAAAAASGAGPVLEEEEEEEEEEAAVVPVRQTATADGGGTALPGESAGRGRAEDSFAGPSAGGGGVVEAVAEAMAEAAEAPSQGGFWWGWDDRRERGQDR